jgi:hypothetical protein
MASFLEQIEIRPGKEPIQTRTALFSVFATRSRVAKLVRNISQTDRQGLALYERFSSLALGIQ